MKQVDFSMLRCKIKVMLFHIVIHQRAFHKKNAQGLVFCDPMRTKNNTWLKITFWEKAKAYRQANHSPWLFHMLDEHV